MGAPAVALGARTAVRHRRLIGVVAIAAGLVVVLPVLVVVAAIGALAETRRAAAIPVLADIPAAELALYRAAAARAGIDWAVLAAIGKIECDHGRSVTDGCRPYTANSAGAVGPMQFLPSTWAVGHRIGETRVRVVPARDGEGYATDGDGDGVADIWNPADAIASAAGLLVANGAPGDYRRAVLAYNHAGWYVDEVLARAAQYRSAWAALAAGAGLVGIWAEQYLGTPYVWGGNHGVAPSVMLGPGMPLPERGRDGRVGYFDCSSLASWAYAKTEQRFIGDTTTEQWALGGVSPDATRGADLPVGGLRAGDLVFFHAFDHVGIYLGGDLMVDAPHTGANVEITRFSSYPAFAGWVRYTPTTGAPR